MSDEPFSDDSIVQSSDTENLDTDTDDENDKEHGPIFEGADVTYQEHSLAIMSLAARHNLNQTQLPDLIEIIKLHCPSSGTYVSSGKSIHKEVTGCYDICN